MTHQIAELYTDFDSFLGAQAVTEDIIHNLSEWVEYVRDIQEDANENTEIASFFSSIVTHLYRLNDKLKQTIAEAKSILGTNKTKDDRNAALLKRLLNCAVQEIECHFNECTSIANYSTYDDGYTGVAYVAHISNVQNSVCFLLDVDRMPDLAVLYSGKQLKPLNRLPESGEIFAYHLHQKFMFRALRCTTTDSEAISAGLFQYYVKFIDIGCTMWIDTTHGFHNHYALDERAQRIPGYALKCQVIQMPSNYNLMNLLHDKVAFRTLKMGNDLMYVELLAHDTTNPFLCFDEVGGNNMQLYSYFQWNDEAPPNIAHSPWPSECLPSPPSQRIDSLSSNHSSASDQIQYSFKSSYEADRAAANHFLETKNKSFAPKVEITKNLSSLCDLSSAADWNAHEDRMQQFADSLSNDDENDWPAIAEYADVDEDANLPAVRMPSIGDTIRVRTSFVIDVERFYAFIPSCLKDKAMTPEKLESEMNTAPNRLKYEGLQEMPAINQLVFAKYNNLIYRARMVTHYDESNYQVFYLDYGNCSKLKLADLYKWDERWDHVPSMAFLCRLHGLRKIRNFDFGARKALATVIMNQYLIARVIDLIETDNSLTIVLRVRDVAGLDVSQALCEKNFAKST